MLVACAEEQSKHLDLSGVIVSVSDEACVVKDTLDVEMHSQLTCAQIAGCQAVSKQTWTAFGKESM